jgi:hypothetical protein
MQILPNGKCQFFDSNGTPLASGQVSFYAPGTTNPATTYQDQAGTIPNSNPIMLDSNGQAVIWGTGSYRQIVQNSSGTTLWDQVVSAGDAAFLSFQSSLASAASASNGDALVAVKQPLSGAVARTQHLKNADTVSVKDFGAAGTGSVSDSAAFQAAVNACPANTVLNVIVPDGTYLLSANVTAGAGTINWQFSGGASLAGSGTLPFHASSMTYNATPNTGKRSAVWHGTTANPTTDGVTPSAYIQRVDKSITADDAGHLIPALYVTHKRLAGGTGWCYGVLGYLEDQSNTTKAQSVAVAGAYHGTTSGAGWGIYGEATSHSQFNTITGGEFDAFNLSGVDYPYYALNPTQPPPNSNFSCGIWTFSVGGRNSFGIGIGAQNTSQTTAGSWQAGIYMQTWSCIQYGIDIQAQPATLINFKYGASTDGTGITPGGIGLDCGASAAYGTGNHQCAIHLRGQRLGFGSFGFMQFNVSTNALEFWSSTTTRAGRIDFATGNYIPG